MEHLIRRNLWTMRCLHRNTLMSIAEVADHRQWLNLLIRWIGGIWQLFTPSLTSVNKCWHLSHLYWLDWLTLYVLALHLLMLRGNHLVHVCRIFIVHRYNRFSCEKALLFLLKLTGSWSLLRVMESRPDQLILPVVDTWSSSRVHIGLPNLFQVLLLLLLCVALPQPVRCCRWLVAETLTELWISLILCFASICE